MTAEQLVVSEFLEKKEELKDLREQYDCLGAIAKKLLKRNVKLSKAIDYLDISRTKDGCIGVRNYFLGKYDKGFKFLDNYLREKEDEEKMREGTEELIKAIFGTPKEEEEDKEESEEKKRRRNPKASGADKEVPRKRLPHTGKATHKEAQ